MSGSFFDSNILLYLESDAARAGLVRAILADGIAKISVQVLNEIASVMLGKFKKSLTETESFLAAVRASVGAIAPLDDETHLLGLRVARRYRIGIYDSMIVAAALLTDCSILYSEDMHHGLLVENRLRIVNPFA